MLFELSTEYDEDYKFKSEIYDQPVMVKDPDFSELAESDPSITADERLSLWQADWNNAEAMVGESKPFEAFDLDSFVDYVLVQNIVKNPDIAHPKSVYVYKSSLDEGEKYYWGPVWDFDASLDVLNPDGNGGWISRPTASSLYRTQLILDLSNTAEFKAAYKERFNYFYDEIYPDLLTWLDEYAALIEPSAKMDGVK